MVSCFSCVENTFEVLEEEEDLTVNLQSELIAFYPFNEGSLTDESTNSNNLTNTTTASPSTDRLGNPNCAFQFDNSQSNDEFLTTTNTNFLNNLDAFSVSMWYQPLDSTRDGADFEVLLGRGDTGRCPDRNGEWSIGLYDCRRAVFGHNNSVWAETITNFANGCQGEVNALTDNWQHVVAVKNGDEYKIYFNGNLDDFASGNAGCNDLYIAADIGDLFIGSGYIGNIDEIRIYKRELNQAEVTALFELEALCD